MLGGEAVGILSPRAKVASSFECRSCYATYTAYVSGYLFFAPRPRQLRETNSTGTKRS